MQKILRKVMISTIMALLLIVTFGTITFAWIGITTYSRFEPFIISLDVSDLNETIEDGKQAYGLEISLSGEEDSFSTSTSSVELKRNILVNFDEEYSNYLARTQDAEKNYIVSDATVINTFNNIILDQATLKWNGTTIQENSTMQDLFLKDNALHFQNILSKTDNKDTTKVFKFDLYISVYKVLEGDYGATNKLDCFLNGNILRGSKRTVNTVYPYTYPTTYARSYPVLGITAGDSTASQFPYNIPVGSTVSGTRTVDSSSSARIAFAKHNVVSKYHPEYYGSEDSITNEVTELIVYQGGTKYPSYVVEGNNTTYSFGGIMEDELNFALQNYKAKHPERPLGDIPDYALKRKDLEVVYDKTQKNKLINSTAINSTEYIDTRRMMKVTVYFWFEGWDADCFDVIDRSPVSIAIGLTAFKEDPTN